MITRKILWALAILALLLTMSGRTATALDDEGQGARDACVHELRYEAFAGLILVSVTVNESPPLDFVLDSGATQSAINDPFLAEAVGLEVSNVGLARGMGSGATWVVIAGDVSIGAGGREILRAPLVVHDIGVRLAEMAGREIDGFLGAELFERYVVEIDPVERRLLLHDPATFVDGGGGELLKLEVVDRRPVVEGSVVVEEGDKPIPVRLVADTGSSRSLTLITKSRRRLKPRDEQTVGASVGVVGETLIVTSPIHSLSLGAFTIEEVGSAWAEPYRVPAVRNIPGLNGILGNQLLRRFRVVFDYTNGSMILDPVSDSPDTTHGIPD